jgi:hypothetical protein
VALRLGRGSSPIQPFPPKSAPGGHSFSPPRAFGRSGRKCVAVRLSNEDDLREDLELVEPPGSGPPSACFDRRVPAVRVD